MCEHLKPVNCSKEETEKIIKNIMRNQYPRNMRKYNQIVGFVEISICNRDVEFNVQKTLDTRIQAVGKTKHYIQNMMTNGMHFPIGKLTNSEIVSVIDNYLDSIEKEIKPFYLHRDTYNNLKNYIDFNTIVNIKK